MSEFYIYDTARQRAGLLEGWNSIQWLEHYQDAGEVKIVAQNTEANRALLAEEHRVYDPRGQTCAVIRQLDISDGGAKRQLVARAVLSARLLEDRVVMGCTTAGNTEAGMYALLRANLRGLDMAAAPLKGLGAVSGAETAWGSLLAAEKALAAAGGLGFRVNFDPRCGGETFEVYEGVDRTVQGSEGYVGYLSDDGESIADYELTLGSAGQKNVAVVTGGDGPPASVLVVETSTLGGERRRELHVDAKDIRPTAQKAVQSGSDANGIPTYTYQTVTYTPAEYRALLHARGLEKLAAVKSCFDLRCTLSGDLLGLGRDFALGDRLPVRIARYGVRVAARVSHIKRIYEAGAAGRIELGLSDFEPL